MDLTGLGLTRDERFGKALSRLRPVVGRGALRRGKP